MEEQSIIDDSSEKQKLHDDIARIKAALQSDGGEASAEESYVGSDDDQELQPLQQAACQELPGAFYY